MLGMHLHGQLRTRDAVVECNKHGLAEFLGMLGDHTS